MTSEAFPTLNALVQQFQSQGLMGQEGRRGGRLSSGTGLTRQNWR